ncbi:hypothetical protein ABTW96_24575 [Nocardia beijingensis]|uniref:hypothetical protein n=1 Tax=Nocardia beijingensis TaxID=95162 RepID=UPI00331DE430
MRVAAIEAIRSALAEQDPTMTDGAWIAPGKDVHLRIWLGGVVFDYTATAVAARNVIDDWSRNRWFTIELIRDTIEERLLLPRLPYERLFLGP